MNQRYGKLAWKDLFDKPIQLTRDGFVVSPRLAQSIVQNEKSLRRYKNTADYFLPNSKPLQAGMVLKNQAFADSVRALAQNGAKDFYSGSYAQNIVKTVTQAKDNVGLLSMEDMKSYRIIERQPVCTAYRVYQVCGMGAPSSGGIAVGQILGMLNEFSPAEVGYHADGLRHLGDASRLAFADRDLYVADPDFVPVQAQAMLAPQYLKARSQLIKNSDKSLKEVKAGEFVRQWVVADNSIELPSTSHISIVDADGNVLSMTTSIENAFGSTLMANGYLLNNELTDFSFMPKKDGELVANRVEGGKRPRSSMAPIIVFKDGAPYIAVGSPGG